MNRYKHTTHGARSASKSAIQQKAINITQNMHGKNLNNTSNERKLESFYTMKIMMLVFQIASDIVQSSMIRGL